MVVVRLVKEYLEKHKETLSHFLKFDHLCFLLLLPCILLYAYGFGRIFLQITILLWCSALAYDWIELKNTDLPKRIYACLKGKLTPYQRGWLIDIVGAIIIFIVIFLIGAYFF